MPPTAPKGLHVRDVRGGFLSATRWGEFVTWLEGRPAARALRLSPSPRASLKRDPGPFWGPFCRPVRDRPTRTRSKSLHAGGFDAGTETATGWWLIEVVTVPSLGGRMPGGLVDHRVDLRDVSQRTLDQRPDVRPIEAAQSAAKRRNGDRPDLARQDLCNESGEADLDVFDSAPGAPVHLRWEVDDVAGIGRLASIEDEHSTRLDLAARAGGRVRPEVVRVGALELQRKPTSHHTDTIDGVDQRFRVGLEYVSPRVANHVAHRL